MTQQPFSRPRAIDLSGLERPASSGAPGAPGAPGGAGGPGGSSYAADVTEQNFPQTIEASTTAPVLLVVYSPTRMPESVELAESLETLSGEFEGLFLAGMVDIDAAPSIAQS